MVRRVGNLIVLLYVLACMVLAAVHCATARAGVTPLAEYHKAIITVGQEVNASESFAGTGTLICREGGGWVLTVAHIFEANGPAWVNYTGQRWPARVVAIDKELDVAVLYTKAPPADVPVIPLADDADYAPGGSVVEFCGYGGGQFRHFTANVIGYTERAGANTQVAMDFQSISGDSGGPILYNGKVVGVQWGYVGWQPNTHSEGTCNVYVRRVLTQYRVPICQDGSCYQPQVRPISRPPQQQPLQPVPPKPVKECNCDNAALIARITVLEATVQSLQGKPGPAGPQGPPGPAGPQGPQGVAGKDADVSKLPPITFEVWDDGKKLDSRKVSLGGTLPLERYTIGGK